MAEAFDLILSEYSGYTDETILDLPMRRIRQMVVVIRERRNQEDRARLDRELAIAEVHAKSLGGLLSGLAQTKKTASGIARAAASFDFRKVLGRDKKKSKEQLPSTDAVMRALSVGGGGSMGRRG